FFPIALTLDSTGRVYVSDTQNNAIRLLTPSAAAPLPPQVSGAIGAGAFGADTSVAPGTWIEIYGSGLAGSARAWAGSDFRDLVAPAQIDGTSVTIGGQPAVISYVSAGQVNALAPMTLGSGP